MGPVLIIDDDYKALIVLEHQLGELGYDVIKVQTGAEALKIIKENKSIELMITDAIMPRGYTGWELAEEASSIRLSLKIIIMSEHTRGALLNAGQTKFQLNILERPFDTEALERKIKEVMMF